MQVQMLETVIIGILPMNPSTLSLQKSPLPTGFWS